MKKLTILKSIQYSLVWAKVLKHEGKNSDGLYITNGLNRKNPLSYIILIITCLFVGIFGFFEGIVWTFKQIY